MTPEAIATISAAVVALTQLIKLSPIPTDGLIPLVLVFVLAAVGVGLWGVSYEVGFSRALLFSYFSAWIVVATAAAGVFSVANKVGRVTSGTDNGIPGR